MPLGRAWVGKELGLAVSTTVVKLTVPATAMRALISVKTAGISWLDDGSDPTADNGIPLPAGGYILWLNPSEDYYTRLVNLRFIRSGAVDAALNVIYYR